MGKTWKDKIEKIAERLGWSVDIGETIITFSQSSPEGQNCNIEIEANDYEECLNRLEVWVETYDVSEEAYIWLDSYGHGKNGAPYDMRDVYNDMEWFKNEADELSTALRREMNY